MKWHLYCFFLQCLSLTNQYYDIAYSFLLNELDPKAACTILTLCESSKKTQVNLLVSRARYCYSYIQNSELYS